MIMKGSAEVVQRCIEGQRNVLEATLINSFNEGYDYFNNQINELYKQAEELVRSGIDPKDVPTDANPFINILKLYVSIREEYNADSSPN